MIILPLIFQYAISEMETFCAAPETPESMELCLYAVRVNLGLYSLEQLPGLVALHGHYAARQEHDRAREVAARMDWLVGRNEGQGAAEVVEALVTTQCDDRRHVADNFIMATGIASRIEDWEAEAALSWQTARLVRGVDGPEWVYSPEYGRMVANPEVRGRYRVGTWVRRARRAEEAAGLN